MPSRMLERLADELRNFRRTHGLSQEAMAHRIGCSIPTYRSLERALYDSEKLPDPKLSTIMNALRTIDLDDQILAAIRAEPQPDETPVRTSPRDVDE